MTKTTAETTSIIGTQTTRGPTPEPTHPEPRRSRRQWLVVGALVVGVAVAAILALTLSDTSDDAQTADVAGQGGEGADLASDGARLTRRSDGLFAELDVPSPEPGSYAYPTADMVPPWAGPQPPVSPGARDAPEVFTVWLVTFNDASLCTDGQCDADDVGAEVPAQGGTYQLDGRVADGDRLRFVGNIRLGQEPLFGAPLADPHQAEVHLFMAPHGRALPGADGWPQLNGPVGNPSLWWAARFAGS